MKNIITLTLFLFVCLFGFSQAHNDQIIQKLNTEMEKSFNKNVMQEVAFYYADSAVISGGRMRITGRTGIDNYWMMMKDKGYNWKLVTDTIEDYDKIIIQNGRSYLTKTENGAGRQMNTRFVLVWKRTGDSYKIVYDFFSSL